MNSYPCLTDVITTFHSFNVSDAPISKYPSIVLIMSDHTFFFNKKIMYNLSVSVFIANALNSIMKLAMFFLPCLKVSIFHSTSATFVIDLGPKGWTEE